MVLAPKWYCGDNIKDWLLLKHLLQRKLQFGGWNNLKVMTNVQKAMTSSYQIELKKLIGASCIYNMHTGENVFAAATFEGLWVGSFETVKRLVVYCRLCESSLHF